MLFVLNGNGVPSIAKIIKIDNVTTPLAAPSNLAATAVSSSQINLSWTDNSTDEINFKIERCLGAGCTNFVEIAQTAAGVTSFSNTGLAASTTYNYRVRASNLGGNSAYSNSSEATTLVLTPSIPAAPTSLTATAASSTQINLAWSDNSANEDGFRIERCQGAACTNFVEVAQTAANQASYSNTGLAANTSYSYRVRAFNSGGNSSYSNTASATTQASSPTLPTAPTNLVGTAVSANQINLQWSDNSSNETGFRIERSPDGVTFTLIFTAASNVTNYSNTGLNGNTFYHYRVRAFNGVGDSANSNVVKVKTKNK
jgi:hypothetical protein